MISPPTMGELLKLKPEETFIDLCRDGLSVVVIDGCAGERYSDVNYGGDVPRQWVVNDHVLLQSLISN